MRMIALSALLALGLGFAATTGASAAPAAPAAGLGQALDTTSLLQDVAARCRSVRTCHRGHHGRRVCTVRRVCHHGH
jgi:hypothetical protein